MSEASKTAPCGDRFDAARTLLLVAALFSALTVSAVAGHFAWNAGRPAAAPKAFLEMLDLPTLALVPAGRPERLPLAYPAGGDFRYDPGLHRPAPDPARLLRRGALR